MTGPATATTPDSNDGIVNILATNVIHFVSSATSTILSFLPQSITNMLTSLFTSAQTLIVERWEARVAVLLLMLPMAILLAIGLSIGAAILWPFTFLLGSIGGLAVISTYLFWPATTDIKTCLFSTLFSLGSQLLLVLPVYFLAPFGNFLMLIAVSAYLFATHSWLLLLVTSWWLITTPYWSLIHFITFPFLFTAIFFTQIALSLSLMIAFQFYPSLPSQLLNYYNNYITSKNYNNNIIEKITNKYQNNTNGYGKHVSTIKEVKSEYNKVVDDYPMKEESKTN